LTTQKRKYADSRCGSLGLPPADDTHLALSEGAQDMKAAPLKTTDLR